MQGPMLKDRLSDAVVGVKRTQGLDLPLPDDSGTVAFALYHEGHSFDVYLQAMEDMDMVSLMCPVAPMPLSREGADALLRVLLTANTLGAQTNGLSLGINPVDQGVVLGYSLLGEGVSAGALEEVLGRLLVAAKAWRERLAGVALPGAGEVAG